MLLLFLFVLFHFAVVFFMIIASIFKNGNSPVLGGYHPQVLLTVLCQAYRINWQVDVLSYDTELKGRNLRCKSLLNTGTFSSIISLIIASLFSTFFSMQSIKIRKNVVVTEVHQTFIK